MSTTDQQKAKARVVLYPGTNRGNPVRLDQDVLSLSVTSDLNGGGQEWTITLCPRIALGSSSPVDVRRISELENILDPNQVVSIGFEEDGGITIGLITDISRVDVMSGGSVTRALKISGHGMQKVLQQDQISRAILNFQDYPKFREQIAAALGENNPIIFDLPALFAPTRPDGTPSFIGQGLKDVLDWILKYAPSMRLPILSSFGGPGLAYEYFLTDRSVTSWITDQIYSESPGDYQGTVWGFIQSILDKDFLEVRVDTIPSKKQDPIPDIHLILRPKPYTEKGMDWLPVTGDPGLSWDDLTTFCDGLPYHEIGTDKILNLNLNRSDRDAYSYYVVTSTFDLLGNPQAMSSGLFYPVVDTYIAAHFGQRKYETRLTMVGGDIKERVSIASSDYSVEVSTQVFEARNRLVNWYRLNPWFLSGSVTVAGKDRYRAGDPILLPHVTPPHSSEAGTVFYCTQVSWQWSMGQPYLCTLQLTRGHNSNQVESLKAKIAADGAKYGNPSHLVVSG